jgi:hypothetical protein
MKIIFVFFCINLMAFFACSPSSVNTKITVINNSGSYIDSFKVSSYGLNLNYKKLKPKDSVTIYTSLDYKEYEGNFLTQLYIKDSIVKIGQFGYFSNELEINSHYFITINKDQTISENIK